MNINNTLSKLSFEECYPYGFNYKELDNFLAFDGSFESRQAEAIMLIDGLMTMHGKKELLKHVAELARVEHGIRELDQASRDHVVHAVLSFIVGIYLNERFLKKGDYAVGEFEWKLAGLFHDVGYPLQLAKGIVNQYTDKVNGIQSQLGVKRNQIICKIIPTGLELLQNDNNSFSLLQDRISSWDLDINVNTEYHNMLESGRICHGIISALTVLYVIDMLYEKYNPNRVKKDIHSHYDGVNWNQSYFEREVISACAAIYIHNLPSDRFKNKKISLKKSPLAFLLKLSDVFQDWQRPSYQNIHGFSPNNYDIEILDNCIKYCVSASIDRAAGINKEINESLENDKIFIVTTS